MRWLACAAILAWAAGAPAAEPRGLLVLAGAGDRGREAVLVDALRIYMRDLGRPVRSGGAAPASAEPRELERVAADGRRAEAEVVVWFGERKKGLVLYALRVATREVRETPVESDDPLLAARTAALKVRALLTGRRVDESTWSVPPEAGPPPVDPANLSNAPADSANPPSAATSSAATSSAATSSAAPSTAPPSSAPDDNAAAESSSPIAAAPPIASAPSPAPAKISTPSTSVRAAAPPGERRTWLEAGVTYGATVPTQLAWVRHGLTIRLAAPWGRLPLSAFVDAAFTTEPSTTVDGNPISARIWPVGAGVAFRLRRPRWQLSVGPRASLQIVDADTRAPAGRAGAARRYSAGLGALGEAAWRFSRRFALVASIGVEALLPRLEFSTGGAGATDLGWVQLNFNAGLLVSLP